MREKLKSELESLERKLSSPERQTRKNTDADRAADGWQRGGASRVKKTFDTKRRIVLFENSCNVQRLIREEVVAVPFRDQRVRRPSLCTYEEEDREEDRKRPAAAATAGGKVRTHG